MKTNGSMDEKTTRSPQSSREQPPGKRGRRLLFALILASVLGVVLLAAYRDGTGFDVLRRYFNYGKIEEAGGEALYAYDAFPGNQFGVLGERLVVLSGAKLSVLTPDGETAWWETVNFSRPALSVGGGCAVAYDVGGTSLYVLNQEKILLNLTADEEEPFIAATLNENGWLAVTTEKNNYKGSVQVYNANMELVFAFHSSNRFVMDAYVTNDNQYLAAVKLGQEGGVFVSNIELYDLSQTDAIADYDIRDGLVTAIGQQDTRLATVSDSCVTFADTDGTVHSSYSYNHLYLREYDMEGDGFIALLLNRYQSGSVGKLVTIDAEGQELAALDVSREVLDISAAGRYLAVLYTDSLVVYNQDLQVYASLNGTDFASGVCMREDGSALLLSSENAVLFLP